MAVTAPDTEHTETETGHSGQSGTGSDTGPDVAAVRAAGQVVKRFVSGFEAGRYSGDDSVTLLTVFTDLERTALAGKTLAAARVAQSNVHTRAGHRSPAEFIAATTGDPVVESKDMVKLGEALSGQPALDQALRDGRLSRTRAKRASAAARINPHREDDLVRWAETDSDAGFSEHIGRTMAEGRSKEDAARHRRRLHENRSCREFVDDDGAFSLRATLTPEAGAELQAALDAQADRHFDRARAEGRFENPAAYRADALVALVTGRGILGPKGKRPGDPKTDTTPEPPGRPRDPRATVNVVVDLETLRQGNVQPGERCEIPGVGPVSVEYVRGLLGDCLFKMFVTSATDIHAVWSSGRHMRRDVRAGLILRDPRCVVPGCDTRLGLECDHWVTDFAEGGLTALDNLARICKRHHRQRTHEGYELRRGPEGWEWIPPAVPKVPRRPKRTKKKTRTGTKSPPPTGPPLFDPEE
jgi:hypothetical protein